MDDFQIMYTRAFGIKAKVVLELQSVILLGWHSNRTLCACCALQDPILPLKELPLAADHLALQDCTGQLVRLCHQMMHALPMLQDLTLPLKELQLAAGQPALPGRIGLLGRHSSQTLCAGSIMQGPFPQQQGPHPAGSLHALLDRLSQLG